MTKRENNLMFKIRKSPTTWYRITHRKSITISTMLLFVILGVLGSLASTSDEEIIRYMNAETKSLFDEQGIIITPSSESEIWEIDGILYFYGDFSITNSTSEMQYFRLLNEAHFFIETRSFTYNTSDFGFHSLWIYRHDSSHEHIRVYFSSVSRYHSIANYFLGMLMVVVLAFSGGFGVLYLGVMRPIKKKLQDYNLIKPIPDLEEIPDAKLLCQRTDRIISHLTNEIASRRKEKSSLLTAVGVMVAGYGLLVSEILAQVSDPYLFGTLSIAILIGIASLVIPSYYILADSNLKFRPMTMWHY